MDMVCISGVAIATAVCYLVAEAIKIISGGKETVKRLLPIVSAFLGGGICVGLFFVFPELLPVGNLPGAFVVGLFSGLSATGSNQILKQMQKLFKKEGKD
ncbi:MAG: hypothetical protein IJX02_08090 [Clostridia bacterium]|nr:hypothetical protein [Clostridia bacterium]